MQKHSLDWTLQLDALFIFFILPRLEGTCHCHQIRRLTAKINLTLSFQDGCQQVCVDMYLIQWNLTITKGQGTGEICLLWRSLVISRFFFSYFTIAGVKKIICYTEDFVIIMEVRHIAVPLYETWNTRYPYWKSFHWKIWDISLFFSLLTTFPSSRILKFLPFASWQVWDWWGPQLSIVTKMLLYVIPEVKLLAFSFHP